MFGDRRNVRSLLSDSEREYIAPRNVQKVFEIALRDGISRHCLFFVFKKYCFLACAIYGPANSLSSILYPASAQFLLASRTQKVQTKWKRASTDGCYPLHAWSSNDRNSFITTDRHVCQVCCVRSTARALSSIETHTHSQ